MVKIGIIGGSGLSKLDVLKNPVQKKLHTPYGAPSDVPVCGAINNVEVVVIPRHGLHHNIDPTAVNYRANIWALKELGVTHVLAPTAVGSLREEYRPGDLVFPDQFIDRTTKRAQSFYDGHVVCHIGMAEPFCSPLRKILQLSATKLQLSHVERGTVVTIEGPRFSTRAESHVFRQCGADIINMTTVPEVVLAREAGLCYAAIAMVTDYDCWRESEAPVTADMVLATMKKNADNVVRLLQDALPGIQDQPCACKDAIKSALL
ncbi:S-methyl-5'-thioadenosine phosphorylase [Candidatus Woesearchaeota archaeon]|nr:S-methyl-5'-thioadenosine phosphorylase [Candidatus Woesearchaeota archaeon]